MFWLSGSSGVPRPLEAICCFSQPFPRSREAEGSCCLLLTRDNLCGERELLQPELVDGQLEDGSAHHKHLPCAKEMLSDHSEGPESRHHHTLQRKMTQRLTREYCRDGKVMAVTAGDTAPCPPHPQGQGGKVGHFGKLWKRDVLQFFFTILNIFANIPWLEKIPGFSTQGSSLGLVPRDYPWHGPRIIPRPSAWSPHSDHREG